MQCVKANPQEVETKFHSKWDCILICAVKYSVASFCRGALDIALVHGVSKTEVHCSTWRVVDAIHLDKSMNINFPVSSEEQRCVANNFKSISTSEFGNCAGCADGFLM